MLVVISEDSDGIVPNEELMKTIASFNQYNEKPKVLISISEQVTAGDIDERDIPLHDVPGTTENTLSSSCHPQRIDLPKCFDELSKVLARGAYEWEMEDLVRFFYFRLGEEPNIQRNMSNKKLFLLPKFFEWCGGMNGYLAALLLNARPNKRLLKCWDQWDCFMRSVCRTAWYMISSHCNV